MAQIGDKTVLKVPAHLQLCKLERQFTDPELLLAIDLKLDHWHDVEGLFLSALDLT